jgi:succinate dehydrogenase/fumarate reductase flavoprotein subunit
MKFAYLLIPVAVLAISSSAFAQGKMWRCPGNAYTNDEAYAKTQGCKPVEGGNVTVVTGTKVNGAAAATAGNGVKVATAPQSAASPGQRVDAGEQKARDGEARSILEAELKKSESRLAELQKEFNSGEPEKMGPEHRNYQKYLDRVAELKAGIERTEKDIAGLKRELARGNGASGTAAR